eukprot:NODE_452_length_2238_cov_30.708086_g418_i0.p1 GENE.NODE_452_length_2238_cov_30.708086_g418_i0~~NODE_452_length_2238_cov_30.708086_g418_i0.p1  ORF type:complete len:239 (+),score=33.64 NODE_452_length_2238_cov_30.708086_g418_i0:1347-2063(+)
MFHSTQPNCGGVCPVCHKFMPNMAIHIQMSHGREELRGPRPPVWAAFSWVVCHRPSDGRFLMVNEPAGISGGKPGYWLPAGRVDAGESFLAAAERETEEEAGVKIRITGVLKFMLQAKTRPCPRIVFLAEPLDVNAKAKGIPDWESAGAMWVRVEQLAELNPEEDFRSPDPLALFPAVASGHLVPNSVDTPAFRAFDALVQRLTSRDHFSESAAAAACNEFTAAWDHLKSVYPREMFA